MVTARTTFSGPRASISFPNGHPTCRVCGTCKRDRVLAHQAAGRAVVFIGDGESDRYAAGYADVVFAKRSLVRICIEAGLAVPALDRIPRDRAMAGRDHRDLAGRSSVTFGAVGSVEVLRPGGVGRGTGDPPPGSWPPG